MRVPPVRAANLPVGMVPVGRTAKLRGFLRFKICFSSSAINAGIEQGALAEAIAALEEAK